MNSVCLSVYRFYYSIILLNIRQDNFYTSLSIKIHLSPSFDAAPVTPFLSVSLSVFPPLSLSIYISIYADGNMSVISSKISLLLTSKMCMLQGSRYSDNVFNIFGHLEM